VIMGVKFADVWRINYSYDLPVMGAARYSGGSHEISLGYDFYYRPDFKKMGRRYNLDKVKFDKGDN